MLKPNNTLKKALQIRLDTLQADIRRAGDEVLMMRARYPDWLDIEIKPDNSPVTAADKWANQFLNERISSAFPDDAIVGEEDADKSYRREADFLWFLDPIDGTRSFINGSDDFYVLAGLTHKGHPVLGMHYHPASQNLIYAWPGQPPMLMRGDAAPEPLVRFVRWKPDAGVFIKIPAGDEHVRPGVMRYGVHRVKYAPAMVDMLAPLFGKAHGYISYRPTAYWDLVAPAAIMRSAGFQDSGMLAGDQSPVHFNDGEHKTDFFFSLPPDTPSGFIEHLLDIRRSLG